MPSQMFRPEMLQSDPMQSDPSGLTPPDHRGPTMSSHEVAWVLPRLTAQQHCRARVLLMMHSDRWTQSDPSRLTRILSMKKLEAQLMTLGKAVLTAEHSKDQNGCELEKRHCDRGSEDVMC